jgi:hypothetical protein
MNAHQHVDAVSTVRLLVHMQPSPSVSTRACDSVPSVCADNQTAPFYHHGRNHRCDKESVGRSDREIEQAPTRIRTRPSSAGEEWCPLRSRCGAIVGLELQRMSCHLIWSSCARSARRTRSGRSATRLYSARINQPTHSNSTRSRWVWRISSMWARTFSVDSKMEPGMRMSSWPSVMDLCGREIYRVRMSHASHSM